MTDWQQKVLNPGKKSSDLAHIRTLRQQLKKNNQSILCPPIGAGSLVNRSASRTIADHAKHTAISEKEGRWLYEYVRWQRPQTILELGTNLGISSLYLAKANPQAQITTMEGCPGLAEIAKSLHAAEKHHDVTVEVGLFDELLPGWLAGIEQLDFAYIDGDHREQATIDYFEACLSKVTPESVLVFGDIHWSAGMEMAWRHIQGHPAVRATVDLYHQGWVFFRAGIKKKQDVTLRTGELF